MADSKKGVDVPRLMVSQKVDFALSVSILGALKTFS